LARLKQGKYSAALDAVSQNSSTPANAPRLAVRTAALTATGWKDRADEESRPLAGMNLLPEERALIAPISRTAN